MPAEWLSHSSDIPGRVSAALGSLLHALSRPNRLRQLRAGFIALFALWAVVAAARLIWNLLPAPVVEVDSSLTIINPVQGVVRGESAPPVDIQRMASWHLFGEAGAASPAALAPELPAPNLDSREGIEKGARETRLELTLRGIVASTEDGLGYAIIEHKKRQAVYAVEDKLPVSGEVVLAKVMPRQVVLDNRGAYELLTLFDDNPLDAQLSGAVPSAVKAGKRKLGRRSETRGSVETTALARGFRDRLYQDPQSLADVVVVTAVRVGEELLGYRVSPGKQPRQFEQLGFRQGDLVTGINGIALSDPANTVRLYQTMRTANEAVFELERGGEALSLSVQLENGRIE